MISKLSKTFLCKINTRSVSAIIAFEHHSLMLLSVANFRQLFTLLLFVKGKLLIELSVLYWFGNNQWLEIYKISWYEKSSFLDRSLQLQLVLMNFLFKFYQFCWHIGRMRGMLTNCLNFKKPLAWYLAFKWLQQDLKPKPLNGILNHLAKLA